jgi:hypothetical protein
LPAETCLLLCYRQRTPDEAPVAHARYNDLPRPCWRGAAIAAAATRSQLLLLLLLPSAAVPPQLEAPL